MSELAAFREAVIEAIRVALAEMAIEPSDLFGFALFTDDAVGTLFHVYATRDWVCDREGEDPEIGYISVEWQQAASDEHFDGLSERLRGLTESDPGTFHDAGRTARFEALVDAMHVCREQGLFDADTFLTVGSTDPDELMVELACAAARRLNNAQHAARFAEMMGC